MIFEAKTSVDAYSIYAGIGQLAYHTATRTGARKFLVVPPLPRAHSKRLPGGGFTQESGSIPLYSGDSLARRGLVVVTINYRVGLLGFLAHPELTRESGRHSSGNYGLLDQIAALAWIKRNESDRKSTRL